MMLPGMAGSTGVLPDSLGDSHPFATVFHSAPPRSDLACYAWRVIASLVVDN